ncbi:MULTISPECIES: hypothetical protein [Virgibacillus]|uniref:hypothetical protein n=1 Tax=Virgibacillus TaxID=84406 RepID=UPI00040D0E53|nr:MULTISPECIES: hypothetical protein [Bacillaceae]MDY7046099.1 hypothetical protein [Virgibacillus sp. M23]WBX81670.1 hypothetical protein PD280_08300 [Virgibacillus salarius]
MPSATVLTTISIHVISMSVGFIAYFLSSNLPIAERKQVSQQMISYLVNFVIFIWIGKIVLNLSLFISDPIAVLAYPSNAQAFYFALFLLAIQLWYKAKRSEVDIEILLYCYVPVLLVASFMYQFIEIIWKNNTLAWGDFILLLILLLTFLLLRDRLRKSTLLLCMVWVWAIGKLSITWIMPFTTIFGYMIHPFFFITVGLIFSILFVFKRKKVSE